MGNARAGSLSGRSLLRVARSVPFVELLRTAGAGCRLTQRQQAAQTTAARELLEVRATQGDALVIDFPRWRNVFRRIELIFVAAPATCRALAHVSVLARTLLPMRRRAFSPVCRCAIHRSHRARWNIPGSRTPRNFDSACAISKRASSSRFASGRAPSSGTDTAMGSGPLFSAVPTLYAQTFFPTRKLTSFAGSNRWAPFRYKVAGSAIGRCKTFARR
jgi:hypothetical protein